MKNGTRKQATGASRPPENGDLQAQIKMRAHELWQANGRPPGSELQDWLQAEQELTNRAASLRAAAQP